MLQGWGGEHFAGCEDTLCTLPSCMRVPLQEDWIGLRELNENGRLELKQTAGPHMHFTLDW